MENCKNGELRSLVRPVALHICPSKQQKYEAHEDQLQ